jgi:hypothetical protein
MQNQISMLLGQRNNICRYRYFRKPPPFPLFLYSTVWNVRYRYLIAGAWGKPRHGIDQCCGSEMERQACFIIEPLASSWRHLEAGGHNAVPKALGSSCGGLSTSNYPSALPGLQCSFDNRREPNLSAKSFPSPFIAELNFFPISQQHGEVV